MTKPGLVALEESGRGAGDRSITGIRLAAMAQMSDALVHGIGGLDNSLNELYRNMKDLEHVMKELKRSVGLLPMSS